MKRNLMIKRYSVERDNGTKNMVNDKSYFGTILIDIEDEIKIDNLSIQYTDIDGYQNYDISNINTIENQTLVNLNDIKNENHTIQPLQSQEIFNVTDNTIWVINIKIKEILRKYLFAKIKESRTFKTLKKENTRKKNINTAIYEYIDQNIMDRYEIKNIELYIKYISLRSSNIFNNSIQWDPIFNDGIYNKLNFVNNYNMIKKDQFENLTPIKIIYNQNKKSTDYKFDYYFNINYKKI